MSKGFKDLRSRIKHDNPQLGEGASMNHSASHSISASTVHSASNSTSHSSSYSYSASNHQPYPTQSNLGPPSNSASYSNYSNDGQPHQFSSSLAPNLNSNSASTSTPTSRDSPRDSPLRPARSVRRPQQAPVLDARSAAASPSPSPLGLAPAIPIPRTNLNPNQHQHQNVGLNSRSAQMMSQSRHMPQDSSSNFYENDLDMAISPIDGPSSNSIPPWSNQYSNNDNNNNNNNNSSSYEYNSARTRQSSNHSNSHYATPTSPTQGGLGSLTQPKEPAALNSVISALSAAGRKHQANRIMRGGVDVTDEEEKKRRKNERKIDDLRGKNTRPLKDYVRKEDERTFRVIKAVLRKVKAEWGVVADDDFNSVSLALSLLDDSSLGNSRQQFEEMKADIESSLQGTVDDHYDSFATAITLHNSVLQSLTIAQNSVSSSRKRLRDSREALGSKRSDLVQMWNRSQNVKESLKLLDLIENLKSVPDRLETLLSDKKFKDAVNLLMRSLKNIDKAEILEIGATVDLRNYLKNQETSLLEILIEELHNHLYLKTWFTESRWKAYSSGQESLPNLEWGREYVNGESNSSASKNSAEAEESSTTGNTTTTTANSNSNNNITTSSNKSKPLKLTKYLAALSARPTFDPNLATDLPDLGIPPSVSTSAMAGDLPSSKSIDSVLSTSVENGAGADGVNSGQEYETSPEADSFLYIEMLLESLARLGKVGFALEVVQQRLNVELYQLVESTIEEVDQRNEFRRDFFHPSNSNSSFRPESTILSSSSALARSFAGNTRSSFRSSHTSTLLSGGLVGSRNSAMNRGVSSTESSALERNAETMRDLFWTLFSKLDAVLQGHRVVHEVAAKIASRPGFKEKDSQSVKKAASGRSLVAVWRPIQTEVRNLLHDHLMDDSANSSTSRNNIISVNEVLRRGNFGRDKSKRLFKLNEASSKPGKKEYGGPLRRHEDALTNALRSSVPGLVSSSDATNPSNSSIQQKIIVDSSKMYSLDPNRSNAVALLGGGPANNSIDSNASSNPSASGGGHRLLVKPDAFNVSVLFAPALAFIDRVQSIMPGEASASETESSKGFSAFLDEFVQDVFLPQLEEKVQALFQSAVGGSDAFQEDPSLRKVASRPVVKSAANVVVLIDSLYSMLRTTPFHRESYSRLIIQTIVQFYQRCNERFKDLTSLEAENPENSSNGFSSSFNSPTPNGSTNAKNGSSPSFVISSIWSSKPELNGLMSELFDLNLSKNYNLESSFQKRKELFNLENRFQLQFSLKRGGISLNEIITSRKKLSNLGNLHYSLQWFLNHISRLKASDDEVIPVNNKPTARLSVIGGLSQRSSVIKTNDSKESEFEQEKEELKLPLGRDMAIRYEALPKTCLHLCQLILFTLRLELRARTIHYIDLAISEGNYLVEDAAVEPDPHIVDLNAELASCDDVFVDNVARDCHRFLFSGLASLMDQMLVSAVRKVRAVNRHGVTKMIRNILALQQNLKNIVDEPLEVDFERSRKFWELLGKEPSEMLKTVKAYNKPYSFDELKSVLSLMLGLENGSGSGNTSTPTTNAPPAVSSTSSITGIGAPAGAMLKPGTVNLAGEVSRQKFNEYLIELHEVAAEEEEEEN